MIKLADLIAQTGFKLENYKIHCAMPADTSPLDAFFDGKFKEWQEWQGRQNFRCKEIVSLIQLDKDRWLFGGVFTVNGVRKESDELYRYKTTEVPGFEELVGRVIVSFKKSFRAAYLIGPKYIDMLVVCEIRPRRMSVGDFPGYNSVIISHGLLKTIVREGIPSWKTALSNVSGIYVITDTSNGKKYVGSACGGGGIWERWGNYATTGHGGNKELKQILEKKGPGHLCHFQYSILEIYDLQATSEAVLAREAHWKSALCTREFGYNIN